MKIANLLAALVFVLTLSLYSYAQQTNTVIENKEKIISLRGVVYDPGGAVIVNTRITVKALDNKIIQTTADGKGIFELKLVPGRYQIEFASPGFKSFRLPNFRVVNAVSGKMNQDVVMEIGDVVTPLVIEETKKPK